MRILLAIALTVMAGGANAQDMRETTVLKPLAGESSIASVGSEVVEIETRTTRWDPIARLESDLDLALTKDKQLVVSANSPLFISDLVSGQTFLVCTAAGGLFVKGRAEGACFADTDNDGRFDRAGGGGSLYRKTVEPIPYQRDWAPGEVVKTFKQTLLFSGLDGKTLRMSYREFTDDMARPAFTQDLTFTLAGSYPETVSFKNVAITVLGIDNNGMRYSIAAK